MKITEILRDSNYKLTQFTQDQISKLEHSIFIKEVRGKQVRDKDRSFNNKEEADEYVSKDLKGNWRIIQSSKYLSTKDIEDGKDG